MSRLRRALTANPWMALGLAGAFVTLATTERVAKAEASVASFGDASFPELTVTRRSLDNQLRVVLAEDHSNPTVAVCVTYGVGTRDEGPDQEGVAHLVELSMFQGSANLAAGEHSRLITERGGKTTSATGSDTTAFCQTVKTGDLELALWLEADRMKKLHITPESFQNRRQFAIEQYLGQTENQPDQSGRTALQELVFEGFHGYQYPSIGALAALEGIPIAAVRKFHFRYYKPNNAALSIAGDIDVAKTQALVDRYFGKLPARTKGSAAVPQGNLPEQSSERLDVIIEKRRLTPSFYYGWPIPASHSKEHRALELAGAVLAEGESSRLYQNLVVERMSARGVSAWTLGHAGPDLFALSVSLAPLASMDKVQADLDGELKRLRTIGPTAAELAKAKARLQNELLVSLETNQERANQLGKSELLWRDAEPLNDEAQAYSAVSSDEVRRAVAEYLVAPHRSIVEIYPEGWLQDEPSLPEPVLTRTHTVKAGDSLSAIAHRYRTSIKSLIELNKLNPKKQIIVGKKLLLPPPIENEDDQEATLPPRESKPKPPPQESKPKPPSRDNKHKASKK